MAAEIFDWVEYQMLTGSRVINKNEDKNVNNVVMRRQCSKV